MISTLSNWLNAQDYRYIILMLLLIVLPSLEAPKNLFALLYVFSWLFIAYRGKNWGGKWRVADTLFLFFFVGNIAVSLNAFIILDMPVSAINDVSRYILVVWVLSRHFMEKKQVVSLYIAIVLSTAASLIYSFFTCPQGGVCLELNSVGHVNHTAIYLVITYSIGLSLLLTNFLNFLNYQRLLLILSILFIAYAIVVSNSRAATGFLLIVTLLSVLHSVIKFQGWRFRLTVLFFMVLGSLLVINNPPSVIYKFSASDSLFDDLERKKIRNFAYYVFKTYPILGVGFGNFTNLGHEHIKDKVIEDLGVYEKEKYAPYDHTHNIYYNFLVSGGIVMFSALLWFFSQVIKTIWRVGKENNRKELRRRHNDDVFEYRDDTLLIISSSLVVLTVLGIGFVNTTLSHEHALLSIFVFGLLFSKDRELNAR